MFRLRSRGLNAAIVARFADGNWHSVWEVVAACGHLIPPEIAVRVASRSGMFSGDLQEAVDRGRRRRIGESLRFLRAEPRVAGKNAWESFRLMPGVYGQHRGSSSPSSRLSDAGVLEIRRRYADGGVTYQQLADEYAVSPSTIGYAIKRKTWKHI
jgi:hypothetical protein